jgi:hypothetical protein
MDFWIVVVVAVVLVGVAVMLFGRYGGRTGGITERSMEGRDSTGREGASEPSDRGGAERDMSQQGTR